MNDMKKIFPFFLLLLLLVSCQKDPDTSKLSDEYVVYTDHSKDVNFETEEGIETFFELYGDGEIDKYTDQLYPYEEEKEFQRAYIENMYRYFGYGLWLVFSKETGKLIGRAGLEHREYHEEIELELGYIIGTQ